MIGELKSVQDDLNGIIKKIGVESIKDTEQALDYLSSEPNGILIKLQSERENEYIKLIQENDYRQFKTYINEISNYIDDLAEKRNELAGKTLQINYKKLYESVTELEESDTCPICGTPIKNAVRNPYNYARTQLETFKYITTLQNTIKDDMRKCIDEIKRSVKFIQNNSKLVELLNVAVEKAAVIETDDIENMTHVFNEWEDLCVKIKAVDDDEMISKIRTYNEQATKSNEDYDRHIANLDYINKTLISLNAKIEEKEIQIDKYQKYVSEFDRDHKTMVDKIAEEKKIINFNKRMIEAYVKVIDKLSSYNDDLPGKIATELGEKIIDYYNTINQDDADFEKITKIVLPTGSSDKMYIEFTDGNTAEALQVLSEGHIKILGISILLAKAVHDNLNFIIFDDIVNAIDDDHRNGIADLLMNHPDLSDKQIILSTHGDQFIVKLKDKLGSNRSNNDAIVYRFLPADSLEERGIIVKYSDAETPLAVAKTKFQDNELKESAAKCRQALECISYNLWNTISKTKDGMISVAMRSPKAEPDLSSIVDALKKKTNKIKGMEDIFKELKEIKSESCWKALNKGVHYEDEQKEFERADVKYIIEHLERLDELVKMTNIEQIAV